MKLVLSITLVLASLVSHNALAEEAAVESKLDFGDYGSATLTTKAWEAFTQKKYDDSIVFAKECIKRYQKDAAAMQKELSEPVDSGDKEAVFEKWALNDVGTCYFIIGQNFEKQDNAKEAVKAYKQSVEKFPFAQCWDTQGWFWKPADAAKKQLKSLEFALLEAEDE